MSASPKHVPFDSIYRPDFEVVEERHGKVSLFPHTEQLPKLLRALNLEFYGSLPDRIARVDKRGDGFHKIVLKDAALFFCSFINAARKDAVRLMALPNADLVFKVTVVQQISMDTPLGKTHRFRFYGGPDFFPEIRMCGRRVVFADHVLQRFSSRVPNNVGEDLSLFLALFFGTPHLVLAVGKGNAFIVPWQDSILAFPFKETDDDFFITTCLTINEMNSMQRHFPPLVMNLGYGETFTPPKIRHWLPTKWMLNLFEIWEKKVPVPPPLFDGSNKWDWHRIGPRVKDSTLKVGHGPGSQFFFLDHVTGPCFRDVKPGDPEPQVDELAFYKQADPKIDWDESFARRDEMLRYTAPERVKSIESTQK